MWEPVDVTTVPTAKELFDAKIAIEQVESELEQARLRVTNIEKDLEVRRAWIAPVRRLSYDLLSLTFEFCGEDNWRTPLRISGVSRLWRTLVLATPRAWAFLHVHECGDKKDLIRHFFQHSGQRPIHVRLSESQRYSLLTGVVGRLECLSIKDGYQIEEGKCFPKLIRLFIRSSNGHVAITDLSISRFPALRELICEPTIIKATISSPSSIQTTFPPLQVLSIAMMGGTAWLDLLSGCQSSLVSLRLHLVYPDRDSKPDVLLPMLRYLEIIFWDDSSKFWPIDMKAPAIETYIEGTASSTPPAATTPIYVNLGNVTRMHVFYAPNLSGRSSLRTLQLGIGVPLADVLSQLQSNRSLCPSLELIELLQAGNLAPYETSLVEVNRERSQPISIRNINTWPTALPYEISHSPVCVRLRTGIPADVFFSVGQTCRAANNTLKCRRVVGSWSTTRVAWATLLEGKGVVGWTLRVRRVRAGTEKTKANMTIGDER